MRLQESTCGAPASGRWQLASDDTPTGATIKVRKQRELVKGQRDTGATLDGNVLQTLPCGGIWAAGAGPARASGRAAHNSPIVPLRTARQGSRSTSETFFDRSALPSHSARPPFDEGLERQGHQGEDGEEGGGGEGGGELVFVVQDFDVEGEGVGKASDVA